MCLSPHRSRALVRQGYNTPRGRFPHPRFSRSQWVLTRRRHAVKRDGRTTALANLSLIALSHLFHSLSKVLFTFPSRYL